MEKYTTNELLDVLPMAIKKTKELTKKHEGFVMTTLGEAVEYFDNGSDENAPRGEYVLVIKGKSAEELEAEKAAAWVDISVTEHVDRYIAGGMSKKDAIKQVALDRNLPKREVYAAVENAGS